MTRAPGTDTTSNAEGVREKVADILAPMVRAIAANSTFTADEREDYLRRKTDAILAALPAPPAPRWRFTVAGEERFTANPKIAALYPDAAPVDHIGDATKMIATPTGPDALADLFQRLDDVLVEESPMHPFGCATWEESSRIAIDMAKDTIRALAAAPTPQGASVVVPREAAELAINLDIALKFLRLSRRNDNPRLAEIDSFLSALAAAPAPSPDAGREAAEAKSEAALWKAHDAGIVGELVEARLIYEDALGQMVNASENVGRKHFRELAAETLERVAALARVGEGK